MIGEILTMVPRNDHDDIYLMNAAYCLKSIPDGYKATKAIILPKQEKRLNYVMLYNLSVT